MVNFFVVLRMPPQAKNRWKKGWTLRQFEPKWLSPNSSDVKQHRLKLSTSFSQPKLLECLHGHKTGERRVDPKAIFCLLSPIYRPKLAPWPQKFHQWYISTRLVFCTLFWGPLGPTGPHNLEFFPNPWVFLPDSLSFFARFPWVFCKILSFPAEFRVVIHQIGLFSRWMLWFS